MDTKKIEKLTQWIRTHEGKLFCDADYDKHFADPLMEAFGEDVGAILGYLDKMELDDLNEISGIFEYIYGKFMTDEVYDALGLLEEKLKKAFPQSYS